ncbi:hypothetical protein BT69DRAFT_1227696, partial [Atractiella rhizophila]
NARIIDYTVGHVGSKTDGTVLKMDRVVPRNYHSALLADDEWCWADLGYPIQDWLIILYDQATVNAMERLFNAHLSHIPITTEHAIGYLKGCFQSLKELLLLLNNQQQIAMI